MSDDTSNEGEPMGEKGTTEEGDPLSTVTDSADQPVSTVMSKNPEPMGELPGSGETSTPARTDPRQVDASGTVLTLTEVTERYEVSMATLRRRLGGEGGEIPGAHKVPGPKGEQWVIPAAAIVAMGYRERRTGAPSVAAATAGIAAAMGEVDELVARADKADALAAKVAELEAELGEKRGRLDELTEQVLGLYAERKELTAAALDGAEMAGRLAEIEKRHAAELEAARRRRRLFRRSK